MHLERSNATIVSANAPRALKRLYSMRNAPLYPHSSRLPTRGIPTRVFRQGYSDKRYSDRTYSDRVWVFPQGAPSSKNLVPQLL